jgi:hypothetical protein
LFDVRDDRRERCVEVLKGIREPISTTVPVLTEAFHMLGPASLGSDRLREFIENRGLSIWFVDRAALTRAFELRAAELAATHRLRGADAVYVTSKLRLLALLTCRSAVKQIDHALVRYCPVATMNQLSDELPIHFFIGPKTRPLSAPIRRSEKLTTAKEPIDIHRVES